MPSAITPQLTVIVATLDRCKYLRLCLGALSRQSASFDSFEVIVVDNGSIDETADVARGFCADYPNMRYVLEKRKGLSIARNTGVQHSISEIVAFTDDDAVPDARWVERIAARFQSLEEDVAVIGGEVNPLWEAPRPDWLTNEMLRPLSAGLMWSPTARLLRGDEWLVEVNIAYRKARLIEFGGFAEQLGRIGDTLLSCEGYINILMFRAGLRGYYDPDIRVGHHIHASRLTRSWFRRRHFWQGVSLNRVHSYLEQMSIALNLPQARSSRTWEEITVPASPEAWADLFDDRSAKPLEQQLYVIEQLGYLMQSQSLIMGR